MRAPSNFGLVGVEPGARVHDVGRPVLRYALHRAYTAKQELARYNVAEFGLWPYGLRALRGPGRWRGAGG